MSKSKAKLKRQLAVANKELAKYSLDSTVTYPQTSASGGWSNFQNAFGIETDPTFNTIWLPPLEFTHGELVQMYQNPLMYRIINLNAGDGTRKGFELVSQNNQDNARNIQKEMDERFNWLAIGAKMIGIRHQFGGGVIYVDVDDGREPHEPLNENRVRKVWSFQTVEAFYAHPKTARPIFRDEKPGQPMHYQITIQVFGNSTTFTCHESRLIRFPTFESDDVISQSERVRRRTWPFSTTQRVYDSIKRYGIGMQSESQLLQGFVEDVFKVSALKSFKDLAGLRDFIREQALMKNSMRTRIVGAEDDLVKLATPTTGIKEITADQRRDIGMVSEIPVPILFSEESGELGGSTLSESRKVWHDSIETKQTNQYTPMYRRMMFFVSLETGWDISDIEFQWNSLDRTTPLDQAKLEKEVAEKDKIYVQDLGANSADVLEARWGGGEFSSRTPDFDKDQFEKDLEDMADAEAEEAAEQLEELKKRDSEPEENRIVIEGDE
jgi:phage-related protein (TIGR01555 family)